MGRDDNLHRLHGGLCVVGCERVGALEERHGVNSSWCQCSISGGHIDLHKQAMRKNLINISSNMASIDLSESQCSQVDVSVHHRFLFGDADNTL